MPQDVSESGRIRCSTLPHAMVLVFEPRLSCAVWQDYAGRHRTQRGLERSLREGVKSGEWVAWRLIRIETEVFGNVD